MLFAEGFARPTGEVPYNTLSHAFQELLDVLPWKVRPALTQLPSYWHTLVGVPFLL